MIDHVTEQVKITANEAQKEEAAMFYSKIYKGKDLRARAIRMERKILEILKNAGIEYSADLLLTIVGVIASNNRLDIFTEFGCIILWPNRFAIEGVEI